MLKIIMIKIILLITTFILSGCLNKHGISEQYYSDCKEYYDLQGFYHKKCGKDDIITYKEVQKKTEESLLNMKNGINEFFGEKIPQKTPHPNVW